MDGGGGGLPWEGGLPSEGISMEGAHPLAEIRQDTVNWQSVRSLLECILVEVLKYMLHLERGVGMEGVCGRKSQNPVCGCDGFYSVTVDYIMLRRSYSEADVSQLQGSS